jgi:hypothetical protein
MLDDATAALLRAVLEEVCESVVRSDGHEHTAIKSTALEQDREQSGSTQTAGDKRISAPTMWR